MSKTTLLFLLFVIIVSSVLRLYKLGVVPHGLFWDEAAVGYNGWSITTTHRDEWLEFMPISFKSFGDFKAPLAIYINSVFTYIFGLSAWSIRLPYALSGILTIVAFIKIGLILAEEKYVSKAGVMYGTLLFSIIPWHIHFSRLGFENTIALLTILLALLFLLAGIQSKIKNSSHRFSSIKIFTFMLLFGLFLALSLYASHSAKIFIPVAAMGLFIMYKKQFFVHLKEIMLGVGTSAFLLLPMAKDMLLGEGATRSSVLLDFSLNNPLQFINAIFRNIVTYLNPNYVLFGQTDSYRHGDGVFGILLPGMMVLLLLGILTPLLKKIHGFSFSASADKKIYQLAVLFFIAGMLPGWISQDAPNANRTLLALPSFLIFAMLGWEYISQVITFSGALSLRVARIILSICITVDILWFAAYQYHYYHGFASMSENDFQAGYSELFTYLKDENEEGNLPGTIVLSRKYGQPYIYALLFDEVNPIAYHQGSLNRYLFVDEISIGDVSRKDALIVATALDALPIQPIETIYSSSGAPRFYIYNGIH